MTDDSCTGTNFNGIDALIDDYPRAELLPDAEGDPDA